MEEEETSVDLHDCFFFAKIVCSSTMSIKAHTVGVPDAITKPTDARVNPPPMLLMSIPTSCGSGASFAYR